MKKLLTLLVVLLSLVGYKIQASSNELVFEAPKTEKVEKVENVHDDAPYMCMWSPEVEDCIDGDRNYCICE